MNKIEQWFKAFKAEADAFDIYGAGCVAGDNANTALTDKERQTWLTIVKHCQKIEAHIDAIKDLGKF